MAFTARTDLQPRGYGVWIYKTEDAAATVLAANYFLNAYDLFEIGDRIYVTVVSAIDEAAEAYVEHVNLVIVTRSSSGVTTVEE